MTEVRSPRVGRPLGTTVAIVAVTLLLFWVSTGVTLTLMWGRQIPGRVLAVWPLGLQTREALADRALTTQAFGTSDRLAREVLQRDPTSVVAARTAGLTAGVTGNAARSTRLLHYAESLSRRDLATQLALNEQDVIAGNVDSALRHYDTALRTSDRADQVLMPILVAASRQPAIAKPLARMLSHRPPWRLRFVYSLLTTEPYGPTVPALILHARLNLEDPLERSFASKAIQGLVDRGSAPQAFTLFDAMTGTRGSGRQVRNGDFGDENRVPPIDWALVDDPDLGAIEGPVDGSRFTHALSLIATAGRGGTVARQILQLPPGPHLLGFVAGATPNDDASRQTITLACARQGGPQLVEARFPAAAPAAGIRVRRPFVVPPNCDTQWLSIAASTAIDDPGGVSPWVTAIGIDR